jgi:hypothetical protein
MTTRGDKNRTAVARAAGTIMLVVVLLMMFVVNPHVNDDPYTNETLWEAVHPFKVWDFFALIGTLCLFVFLFGYYQPLMNYLDRNLGGGKYWRPIFWILSLSFFLYYV